MAMFAAFPSTIMDSTTVGTGGEGARPFVVEMAEGRLHNVAMYGDEHELPQK